MNDIFFHLAKDMKTIWTNKLPCSNYTVVAFEEQPFHFYVTSEMHDLVYQNPVRRASIDLSTQLIESLETSLLQNKPEIAVEAGKTIITYNGGWETLLNIINNSILENKLSQIDNHYCTLVWLICTNTACNSITRKWVFDYLEYLCTARALSDESVWEKSPNKEEQRIYFVGKSMVSWSLSILASKTIENNTSITDSSHMFRTTDFGWASF